MKMYRGGSFNSDFVWKHLSLVLEAEEERGNEDTVEDIVNWLNGFGLRTSNLSPSDYAKELGIQALWLSHSFAVAARYGSEVREYEIPTVGRVSGTNIYTHLPSHAITKYGHRNTFAYPYCLISDDGDGGRLIARFQVTTED